MIKEIERFLKYLSEQALESFPAFCVLMMLMILSLVVFIMATIASYGLTIPLVVLYWYYKFKKQEYERKE